MMVLQPYFYNSSYLLSLLLLSSLSHCLLSFPSISRLFPLLHDPIQGDNRDEEAKVAYQALMTIRVFEPTSEAYREFEENVRERQKRDFNITDSGAGSVSEANKQDYSHLNKHFRLIRRLHALYRLH